MDGANGMLARVKMALRLKSDSLDAEISELIREAFEDLSVTAGINGERVHSEDPLTIRAVITYCAIHFGNPDNYEKLRESYEAQKTMLQAATGYGAEEDEDDGTEP